MSSRSRIAVDPAWMRRAARDIESAADDAARGNTDMLWLIASPMPPIERAKVALAYRSTRSVPEGLRAIARVLRLRATLIETSEQMVWGSATGLSRMVAPKWLRKKVIKIAKKTIKITGDLKKLADQAKDYVHLANKAAHGPFWGNFCGAGNKGYDKSPTDTLDACCLKHDKAYKKAGLGAATQFSPSGLMRGAAANRALANCARKQPDGTESGDVDRFDPNHTNKLEIQGDDARTGVMKLFGLMADIGYALKAAEKSIKEKIDKIPGISASRAKELAEWALREAAEEIIKPFKGQLDKLGALA